MTQSGEPVLHVGRLQRHWRAAAPEDSPTQALCATDVICDFITLPITVSISQVQYRNKSACVSTQLGLSVLSALRVLWGAHPVVLVLRCAWCTCC